MGDILCQNDCPFRMLLRLAQTNRNMLWKRSAAVLCKTQCGSAVQNAVRQCCAKMQFFQLTTFHRRSKKIRSVVWAGPNWGVSFLFLKKWAIPGLFFFIFAFSIWLTVNKCSINLTNDWIRTADLWYWKQPLCQLSQNHCTGVSFLTYLCSLIFVP